jgi:hypothetical protein
MCSDSSAGDGENAGRASRRALLAGATGLVGGGIVLGSAGGAQAATRSGDAVPAIVNGRPNPAAAPTPPLQGTRVVLPGGRAYWLVGATAGGAQRPLMIGLHGTDHTPGSTNALFWSAAGGWQEHARAGGYALALGEGVNHNWNVGAGWPGGTADDIGYLLAIVGDAAARVPVDPAQIFTAGFSAGGAMAWTAAATRPDIFTACGSASGWAAVRPRAPIDCWHIHGTGDATVPIRGGAGAFGYTFPAAADEARLAPRGSRVVLYPTNGAHAVPGWMASSLWAYLTIDRARP